MKRVASAALVLLFVRPALAQVQEGWSGDVAERVVSHPHTVAELEAGAIVLPTAPITGHPGGNTPLIGTIGKGDATFMTGLHVLYRGGREWALGAGALVSPLPTSDDNYNGGATHLPRTHSRSYLILGTEGRYIPLHYKWIEGWIGITAGGVVIADRFSTNTGDVVPPILGVREHTIETAGLAFGIQVGVAWMFADRWVAGFATRADQWLLPNTPQCSPLGDCATLTGTVTAFELGLSIGYRLPL